MATTMPFKCYQRVPAETGVKQTQVAIMSICATVSVVLNLQIPSAQFYRIRAIPEILFDCN